MTTKKSVVKKASVRTNKKFVLSGESTVVFDIKLFRIKATRDIPVLGVKKGDLGGLVEKESNLSQDGDAWVYGNARVFGDARCLEEARAAMTRAMAQIVQAMGDGR